MRGQVVPASLGLTSTGLSLLSLSTSNEPETRSYLENSRNWCQQQGTIPCVPPAGNWGSGMHKHPAMVGWQGVSGDLVTLGYCPSPPGLPEIPMSSSQLTRIPSQKKIPLATGREGFRCSDNVRMIPKLTWTIPVKMWMVWGRMRGEGSRSHPNPTSQFWEGTGRGTCPNVLSTQPGRTSSRTIPAERPCLTPNTLGCALRKPRVWNAVLAGAGAGEPEASWAARGSVAGITSVMILTLPASVTVVAAMAWEPAREAEGTPRCLPPPLPPRHGPFAVRNPREVPAGQGHAPTALCSLREARSWNSRQAPLAQRGGFANGGSQNPAGEEKGREGQGTPPWTLQPWEGLDAFPLECFKMPFASIKQVLSIPNCGCFAWESLLQLAWHLTRCS